MVLNIMVRAGGILVPSKQFYSGPELDLSWQNVVPVMGQYSQTNMPESAPFWPRVVFIQFAHRAIYGPVLVTMYRPDIRKTYRLPFGYICRANTGPDTII